MSSSTSDDTVMDRTNLQEEQTPQQLGPKPPWNPSIFYALTFLCGFGAAGILAGINYGRLGKTKLKWPTISLSLALFMALITVSVVTGNVGLGYLINLPFAIVLERIQRPLYKRYKESTISMKGGGWVIPTVTGIASVALAVVSASIGGAILTPWTVHDTGDIVSLEVGQKITGTINEHDDVDAYSFQSASGECYVIQTSTASTSTPLEDTFLTLWYSDGITILASNDDYAGSLHACIEWTAEASGMFYVTVENADWTSTGDYVLSITCIPR